MAFRRSVLLLLAAASVLSLVSAQEAPVVAPTAACNSSLLPSAPTKLTAMPGDQNVTLCWGSPSNVGCVDEYRVAVRVAEQRSNPNTLYRRTNKSGCLTIDKLRNGELFQFSVQAYSAGLRGGGFTSVLASPIEPPKAWRCLPVTGSYPLCSAARSAQCAPLTCAAQAAKGQCGAAWMRATDWPSKTVVQHCSEMCGCSADPNLNLTLAASQGRNDTAADETAPRVTAFDGGVSAAISALTSDAAEAGRPATPSNVQSPTGCCVGPVRPNRNYGAEFAEEEAGEERR